MERCAVHKVGKYEIHKRNMHSRYGNWEVFEDKVWQGQFHTLKEAKAWCEANQ